MAEHALLSASGADRWINCPPSARLEEAMDDETSEYAREGSFAHSLAETYLAYHLGQKNTRGRFFCAVENRPTH